MTVPQPLQAAATAIRTRVWDWAVGYGAGFDTSRLQFPNRPQPKANGTPWGRLVVRNGRSYRLGIGDWAKRRHIGVGLIDLFGPAMVGSSQLLTLADSLCNTFRNQADGGVTYEEPSAREVEQEADLYHLQVEIPWYLDFDPDQAIAEASYPVLTVTQAVHGLAAGEAVYNNAGTWTKAVATAEVTLAEALVVSVPDANTVHIGFGPTAKVPAHGMGAAATQLYLSRVTPGLLVSLSTRNAEGRTDLYQLFVSVIDANVLRIHDRAGAEV